MANFNLMVELQEIQNIIMELYSPSSETEQEEVKKAFDKMYDANKYELTNLLERYKRLFPQKLFEEINKTNDIFVALINYLHTAFMSLKDFLAYFDTREDVLLLAERYISVLEAFDKKKILAEEAFREFVEIYIKLSQTLGNTEVKHGDKSIKISEWFIERGMYKDKISALKARIEELEKEGILMLIKSLVLRLEGGLRLLGALYHFMARLSEDLLVSAMVRHIGEALEENNLVRIVEPYWINIAKDATYIKNSYEKIKKVMEAFKNYVKKRKEFLERAANVDTDLVIHTLESLEDRFRRSYTLLTEEMDYAKTPNPATVKILYEISDRIDEDEKKQLEDMKKIWGEMNKIMRLEKLDLWE